MAGAKEYPVGPCVIVCDPSPLSFWLLHRLVDLGPHLGYTDSDTSECSIVFLYFVNLKIQTALEETPASTVAICYTGNR